MTDRSGWFHPWSGAWRRKAFRVRLLLASVLLGAALLSLVTFLQWVERRSGVVVPDPVLAIVGPIDLTWPIFGLIYLSLITALIAFTGDPEGLTLAMLAYALTAGFRMAAMFLLPLDPPATAIPLQDPFVQLFGTGDVLMRDLFFSGHTSTLLLLTLATRNRRLRFLFACGTIGVALGVILHHAHYAVDVLVAPFVAYTAYRLARMAIHRFDPESSITLS